MIQSSSPSSRAGGPGGGGGGAIARVSAVKVVVLGPPSVGSSSLVRRFCVDTFEEDDDDDEEKSGTRAASSAHTWGARFHSKLLLVAGGEGHVLRFQIWDVPGGDELLAPVYLAQVRQMETSHLFFFSHVLSLNQRLMSVLFALIFLVQRLLLPLCSCFRVSQPRTGPILSLLWCLSDARQTLAAATCPQYSTRLLRPPFSTIVRSWPPPPARTAPWVRRSRACLSEVP